MLIQQNVSEFQKVDPLNKDQIKHLFREKYKQLFVSLWNIFCYIYSTFLSKLNIYINFKEKSRKFLYF